MKQITKKACAAFVNCEELKTGNTTVTRKVTDKGNVWELHLFGNLIAWHGGGKLRITNAGWPTYTTKERLNGLPNVSINQVRGKWFLNGVQWDGRPVIIHSDKTWDFEN
jgi:hypothetical protein